MDKYQLKEESDNIVIATVTGKNSFMADNGTMIYTTVTVRVSEVVTGSLSDTLITILNAGGTVGDLKMQVFGEANFDIGEKTLLFIKKTDFLSDTIRQDLYEIPGRAQGKFGIFEDENGNPFIYNTLEDGFELIEYDANGKFKHVEKSTEAVSLNDFLKDLK